MAEDRDKAAPSLEPPSLFGRKKKKSKPAPVEVPPEPPRAAEAPAPPEPPAAVERVAAQPEPAEPEPSAEPEPRVEAEAAADPEAPAEPSPPAPEEPVTTIFEDTSEPTPDVAPEPEAEPAAAAPIAVPMANPAPPAQPAVPREPWLTGPPAAVLTGLLVGALIVAATSGSLHLCTAVKGTSSCGNSGFFLLVAILVVGVLVGAAMLRSARVPDPISTSFLAVGLLSVVTLLFLVGAIFKWWMIIVIPLVSVATYLLSHWVTTTYIDPADDGSDPALRPEEHDVR